MRGPPPRLDSCTVACLALPAVDRVVAGRALREGPLATVDEHPSEAVEAPYARLVERDTKPAASVANAGRAHCKLADVSPHGRSVDEIGLVD